MHSLNSSFLKRFKFLKHVNFSLRKSSNFLVNDNKYSFLKELGLNEENAGVYDGKWDANGNVSIAKSLQFTTFNPLVTSTLVTYNFSNFS